MLKDDFYRIVFLEHTEQTAGATLQLNQAHAIFKGHFPNQPVVPGVCQMQMVKEILETILAQPLVVTKADYLKFIVPIVPNENQQLQLNLKYSITDVSTIKVTSTLIVDTVTCFKFQGMYRYA